MPYVDGFDLIALPRARRLARARQRQLWGWLGALLCAAMMLFVLDAIGTWRQRVGTEDQGRHRALLRDRARSLAPAWREAAHLVSLLDHAAARTTVLDGFDDRRWALQGLLDASARAATPALALQRMHYHAAGKPYWTGVPVAFDRGETGRSLRFPMDNYRSAPDPDRLSDHASPRGPAPQSGAGDAPNDAKERPSDDPDTPLPIVEARAGAEGASADGTVVMRHATDDDAPPYFSADAFDLRRDRSADAALLRVLPHTTPLALTVEGIADDAASVRKWITGLERDARIAAVIVDAFVRETARPTPSVWGGRSAGQPSEATPSSPIRFRVSLFGRVSTRPSAGAPQ